LAGNEDFALTRQKSTLGRRSEGIHSDRSAYSFSITSSDGQVKDYLSPTGDRFESHVMHDVWGVWAGTGPQTMLVTVIDVQGQVDCTGLKQKVEAFEQKDDVWDQVGAKAGDFTVSRAKLTHRTLAFEPRDSCKPSSSRPSRPSTSRPTCPAA
jgi:hypothetical protein